MPVDRLPMLRKLVESRPSDPFPRYGLAMELKQRGLHDESVAAFRELQALAPAYVPTYLMFGGLLRELGRRDEARAVLDQGIAAARAAGDSHALSELTGARGELDEDAAHG
jgi:tetratricopeptide (TPR) repeat protein